MYGSLQWQRSQPVSESYVQLSVDRHGGLSGHFVAPLGVVAHALSSSSHGSSVRLIFLPWLSPRPRPRSARAARVEAPAAACPASNARLSPPPSGERPSARGRSP